MRKDCRKAKFYVGDVSDRDYVGWLAVQVRRKGSGAAPAYVSGRHETRGEIGSVFLFPASVNLASQNQLIEYAQSMRSR